MALMPPGAGNPPPAMPESGGSPDPTASAGMGGPAASPMSTPQPQEGLQKAARVDVQIAIKQLQKTLPSFPVESDENKAVLKALSTLSSAFGKTEDQDRGLIPAEIMQLLSSIGPGTQAPGAAAMGAKPTPGVPGIPA